MLPSLEARLAGCGNLPSLPGVAIQLVAECQSPDINIDRVCDLVSRDPALAAKLVSVANSALYRRGEPVSTVRRATLALGPNAVVTLGLSFSLVGRATGSDTFDFARFWRRSLMGAVSARALAQKMSADPEEALFAGLLQDIGILALRAAVPDYDAVLGASQGDHLRLERLERETFGAGHPEVGAWLATRMHLPDRIVRAVRGSHVLIEEEQTTALERCVAVSSYMAEIWIHPGPTVTHAAAEAASVWLSLPTNVFEQILVEVGIAARDLAGLFEVTLPNDREMQDVLQQARDALVHVSLRATQLATRSEADVKRLSAEKQTLEKRISRDPMTGVFSRQHLDASLARSFDNAYRFDRPISVLFCDIDHFKNVNDTYGHTAGDKVLAAVAREIGATVRQLDVVGRYGGEEFVVLLPATDDKGSGIVAGRIRARVAALSVATDRGPVAVTISIGVATHGGRWKASDVTQLVAAADAALYVAKRNGRYRVVQHTPSPSSPSST